MQVAQVSEGIIDGAKDNVDSIAAATIETSKTHDTKNIHVVTQLTENVTLTEDEESLVRLLKDESKINTSANKDDVFTEEPLAETNQVTKPSARILRRASTITWKYEKCNITEQLIMTTDEEVQTHSMQYPYDNHRERGLYDTESKNINAARTSHPIKFPVNPLARQPSLSETFDIDISTQFSKADTTTVGCKKVAIGDRIYYQVGESEESMHMVYEPAEAPEHLMVGKTDKVIKINDTYVSLRPNSAGRYGNFTDSDKNQMSRRLQLVENYKCVCKGWIVENNKYIFEYGGKDVKDFCRTTNTKLKLPQLIEFLTVVKDMHNQDYFFCRLSNHNLLCFDQSSPVKFTGWKYLAGHDVGVYEYKITDEHLVPKSFESWCSVENAGTSEEQRRSAKIAERYAVLMMVCEATSAPIARSINSYHYQFISSMMVDDNKKHFVEWVSQNIQSDYQDAVLLFINNPMGRPLDKDLIDMLAI